MPTVSRVAVECWVGQGRHVVEREHPTADDLRALFERLNGRSEDTLSIETDDHASLLVGGGPDGFVAVSFLPDGSSFHAERSEGGDNLVALQVGGQVGEYPARCILDRASAWEIAKRFFESRMMSESFTWKRDVAPEHEWSELRDEEKA